MPETLKTIGEGAFAYCISLKKVVFPDSYIEIGNSAFYWCTKLETTNLVKSTKIGISAFKYCESLTNISIDANGEIGNYVFDSCYKLKEISFIGAPKFSSEAFYGFAACNVYFNPDTPGWTDPVKKYNAIFVATETAHHYEEIITPAKCTADGEKLYKCKYCDDSYTESIPAIGHDYEKRESVQDCVTDGYEYQYCKNCEDIIIDETTRVAALGHDMQTKIIDPRCAYSGYTLHTCSRCDYSEKTDYTNPTGNHTFVFWGYKTQPTCTEDGIQNVRCSVCGTRSEATAAATGHSYVENITLPTCTEEGLTSHNCINCGDSYCDNYVLPLGHTWDAGIVVKSSTCSEMGTIRYTCSECSETTISKLPLSNVHNYSSVGSITVVSPICDNIGYTIYVCDDCGKTTRSNFVDCIGHTMKLDSSTAATCTEDGKNIYKCETCGKTVEKIIYATGHVEKYVSGIAATCMDDGKTSGSICAVCGEYIIAQSTIPATGHTYDKGRVINSAGCDNFGSIMYTCEDCGHTYSIKVVATGHDYVGTVIAPTCQAAGYTKYTCNNCGDIYHDDFVAAVGHSWDSGKVEKQSNCSEMGTIAYTCTACSETKSEKLPLIDQHTYDSVESITVVNPTCESIGYTIYVCDDCGQTIYGNYVNSLGHSMKLTSTVKATCLEDGKNIYKCEACDKTDEKKIQANGHVETYINGKKATCTEDGLTSGNRCAVCGETIVGQDVVPATGHNYDEGVVINKAGCENFGTILYTCKDCGHTYTEKIEAIGHNYVSQAIEATCEISGYTKNTCKNCGDTYFNSFVSAFGHDMKTVSFEKATCTENGKYIYKCENCDKTAEKIIRSTGHIEMYVDGTNATCTDDGKTDGTKCSVCGEILVSQEIIPATGHTEEVDERVEPTTASVGYTEGIYCSVCNEIIKAQEVIEKIPYKIVSQPTSITVKEGATATFTISAVGAETYQWQYRTSKTGTWINCSSATEGYDSEELKPLATAKRNGYQYRCIIEDAYGNKLISQTATLKLVVFAITSQPSAKTVNEGDNAEFKVVATGAVTYQWQ